MLKKILLGGSLLSVTIGMVSISLLSFSNHLNSNVQADSDAYNFVNYSEGNDDLNSDLGRGVAIDSGFNRIAYTSSDKGFELGAGNTSGGYTFTPYSAASTTGISSDNGRDVALYSSINTENIGYASEEASDNVEVGGLTVGALNISTGVISFHNYISTTTAAIGSNIGRSVAFGSNSLVGYASANIGADTGGLSIGRTTSGIANYSFEHFDGNTPGFTRVVDDGGGFLGEGIAFSSDGNTFAYADGFGGLTVGKYDSSATPDWDFTNYNTEDGVALGSNEGRSVAFNSKGDIAYGSTGGVSIGILGSGGAYTFQNYNSTDSGIASDACEGVAFSPSGALAYTGAAASGTDFNSLSIGIPDSSNDQNYTFKNYSGTSGIPNADGQSVAFGNSNQVLVATNGSDAGGISLGTVNQPTASFDLSDLNYNLREDNRFNISSISFGFNYPLYENPSSSNYVRIIISNNDNNIIVIYLTRTGDLPTDAISNPSPRSLQFNTDGLTQYTVSDLTANGAGFAGSTSYTITAAYGANEDSLTTIGSNAFTTPQTLVSDFNSDQIEYVYDESTQSYLIQSINFGFNRSLGNLSGNYYVLVQIATTGNSPAAVFNFYITLDGELPSNVESGVPNKSIQVNDGSTYAASNLGISFSQTTTYSVSYYLASDSNSTQTSLGSGSFVSPTYTPPVPNLPSSTSNASLGLAIGLGAGIPAAGVSVISGYFIYRFINRGRRKTLI